METMVDIVLQLVNRCRDVMFCFVRRQMSSLSIPPLPSDVFRDRAMESAVSDIMFDDWGGTRKKEKLEGVSCLSQNRTPVCSAVARPAGT